MASVWLAVGFLVGLTACNGGGSSASSEGRGPSAVPERLDTIEAAAEDIIDIVPRADWVGIADDVRDIEEAWSGYRRRALADGARATLVRRFDRALDRLQVAADRADGPLTAQAANDLSAPTVEMYGLYDIGRPIAIGRLDVIGRQIIFDIQRGDVASAGAEVRKAASIWKRGLRADILAQHGEAVAARTDRLMTEMRSAVVDGEGATLVARAKAFLEVVDGMERLY
jgi:hypothetical protein